MINTRKNESFHSSLLSEMELIGRGGFGEVYYWRTYNCAVKVIKAEKCVSSRTPRLSQQQQQQQQSTAGSRIDLEQELVIFDKLDRFASENRHLLQNESVMHPNIVALLDSFVYCDRFYLVLEYANNGSLKDLIQHLFRDGQYLSPMRQYDICLGMAQGLWFLHTADVCHCDLKPENILLHGESPKIADFGLSRVNSAEDEIHKSQSGLGLFDDESNLVGGSFQWAAPEYFESVRDFAKFDVFSLGNLMYYTCTKTHYCLGKCERDVANYYDQRKRQEIPHTLDPRIKTAIEGAWRQEPRQRFSAADIVQTLKSSAHPQSHSLAYTTPMYMTQPLSASTHLQSSYDQTHGSPHQSSSPPSLLCEILIQYLRGSGISPQEIAMLEHDPNAPVLFMGGNLWLPSFDPRSVEGYRNNFPAHVYEEAKRRRQSLTPEKILPLYYFAAQHGVCDAWERLALHYFDNPNQHNSNQLIVQYSQCYFNATQPFPSDVATLSSIDLFLRAASYHATHDQQHMAQIYYILAAAKDPRNALPLVGLYYLYLELPSLIPFPRYSIAWEELKQKINSFPIADKVNSYEQLTRTPSQNIIVAYLRAAFASEFNASNIPHNILYQRIQDLAQSNIPCAIYHKARCLQLGVGVEMNLQEAAITYEKAATLGHVTAMVVLGEWYYLGNSVYRNVESGKRYLSRAFQNRHATACYDLALILLRGNADPTAMREARRYLELASQFGCSKSLRLLRNIEFNAEKQKSLMPGFIPGPFT
eukprot:TRINITY_DN5433_c0_g1_i1.p1 TRINITY_DN5433_c0_g1~~TRINITY_DN5433_c0_g1_i1.p1  ORF type:complete len:758 (+),score=132.42 TRINITY_DN5433_c0_g1_i1:71-2344(+)